MNHSVLLKNIEPPTKITVDNFQNVVSRHIASTQRQPFVCSASCFACIQNSDPES